jgi:hypothetical protein
MTLNASLKKGMAERLFDNVLVLARRWHGNVRTALEYVWLRFFERGESILRD